MTSRSLPRLRGRLLQTAQRKRFRRREVAGAMLVMDRERLDRLADDRPRAVGRLEQPFPAARGLFELPYPA